MQHLTTHHALRALALCALVAARAWAEPSPLPTVPADSARPRAATSDVVLDVPFFGERLRASAPLSPSAPPSASAREVLAADERELRPLAQALERESLALGLDSYGRFRMAVAAVDGLGLGVVEPPRDPALRTLAQARADGEWSPSSRLLAIAALLRGLGYAAAPFEGESTLLLGIPALDDDVNGRLLRERFDVGSASARDLTWLLWDGSARVGEAPRDGAAPGELKHVLPQRLLLDGPSASFHFYDRRIPEFTLKRMVPARLPMRHGGIDLVLRPDAAAYLDLFPEYAFARQLALAREEMALLWDSADLRDEETDEVALVTDLLRSCQSSISYRPGRLGSLFAMLEERAGDCDQVALLLAAALGQLGYETDDLRALRWDDHVALALRPRGEGPATGAARLELPAGRFVVLDPTFYRRLNGEIVTRWGDLPDEHPIGEARVIALER